MNDTQVKLMHSGKIAKVLLKLGIPTMIGMLISMFYNIVDAYFVGALGTSAIGAVSVFFPVGQIIIGLGVVFGGGAASYISLLLGDGQIKKASQAASTALISSVIMGVIVIVGSLFFIDNILIAFGATPTILPYAREYGIIFIVGSIFNIFTVTTSNIITAEGVTRYSMISMATGGILHIILDPIMIYGLGWGIKGAAIATIVSNIVSFGLYLRYILLKKGVLRLSIKNFLLDKTMFSQILKVGVPIFVFQLLASMAMGFTNTAASAYGDAAVAAMGIVMRVLAMGSYVVYGFLRGFQPLAGYSYGANLYDRLRVSLKTTVLWTTAFSVFSALMFILFAPNVVGLFSSDPAVIEIGSRALRVNAAAFIPYGFEMTYAILFLALGRIKEGGIFTVARQGLFFIPVVLLLPRLIGLNGVIFAQLIADILTTVLCTYFALKTERELKNKRTVQALIETPSDIVTAV